VDPEQEQVEAEPKYDRAWAQVGEDVEVEESFQAKGLPGDLHEAMPKIESPNKKPLVQLKGPSILPSKAATLRVRWSEDYEEILNQVEKGVQEKLEVPPDRVEDLIVDSNWEKTHSKIEEQKLKGQVGRSVVIQIRVIPINRLIFYCPQTVYKEAESKFLVEEMGIGLPHQVLARVFFGFNLWHLDYDDQWVVDQTAKVLNQLSSPDRKHHVVVAGYTDVVGTRAYNRTLSERRAKAVAERLKAALTEAGAPQVKEYGHGERGTDKDSEDVRSGNRRVVIHYHQDDFWKKRPKTRSRKQRRLWPASEWASVPWSQKALDQLEDFDFYEYKRALPYRPDREIRDKVRARRLNAEPILRYWSTRYGKWDEENLNKDPLAKFFCEEIAGSDCGNEESFWIPPRTIEEVYDQLYDPFQKKVKPPLIGELKPSVNLGPGVGEYGGEILRYHNLRFEWDSRDPTSVDFNRAYQGLVMFMITDRSLEGLSHTLSDEDLKKLGMIKHKVKRGEEAFLNLVRTVLDDKVIEQYKLTILGNATIPKRVEPHDKGEIKIKNKDLKDEIERLKKYLLEGGVKFN